MKRLFPVIAFLFAAQSLCAQTDAFNQINENGEITSRDGKVSPDSLGSDEEIPTGIYVWTIDDRFGDITKAEPDTVPHMFMNTIFTTGLRGEFNTTGNLGSPRINRVFADREATSQFPFLQPYDFIITPVSKFHFTNTLSPITNLTYNTCGDRTNGEDHVTARFAVNASKRLGFGFKFDYLYGRGYYSQQSTSHIDYTMYGSYLGERYQAHAIFSTNHQKVTENGGITNDNYITHPESFDDTYQTSEIPTVLTGNWNRNDNQHFFLNHRYSVGFKRKVPMTEDEIKAKKFAIESNKEKYAERRKELARKRAQLSGETFNEDEYDNKQEFSGRPEGARIVGTEPVASEKAAADKTKTDTSRVNRAGIAKIDSLLALQDQREQNIDTSWTKDEYVPVTSFIHTIQFDNYRRIYEAYASPSGFYNNDYGNVGRFSGDSIYDETRHYNIKNTFAISLLEGFNKWMAAGFKAFIASDLRHFELPDTARRTTTYNEHNLSIGAQISRTQGKLFHFNAMAETWLAGEDAGQLKLSGNADLNFRLFGDTVTLAASGFFSRENPSFYFRHYHSRHFWWDNGLDMMTHTRLQGLFNYRKTRTTLRFAIDELTDYTYLSSRYETNESYNRLNLAVNVRQSGSPISVITASLQQDFTLGPLNWETVLTYQKSTMQDIIPVPDLNVYTNLYLRFKIAHVLKCDFGADIRYFTKYYAPEYCPALGQYTVQGSTNKVEIGNYPLVNVYANFHLKHTRFFVMASHVNAGSGNLAYFASPHYPLNDRVIRFGVSWNFFN